MSAKQKTEEEAGVPFKKWTFADHKETTALDIEAIAKQLTEIATAVRAGNFRAFETYFFEGGTEEGDAKINAVRELLAIRYSCRQENLIT